MTTTLAPLAIVLAVAALAWLFRRALTPRAPRKPSLKILALLAEREELYEHEIVASTSLSRDAVYVGLEQLKTAGLIESRLEPRDVSTDAKWRASLNGYPPQRRLYRLARVKEFNDD